MILVDERKYHRERLKNSGDHRSLEELSHMRFMKTLIASLSQLHVNSKAQVLKENFFEKERDETKSESKTTKKYGREEMESEKERERMRSKEI